MWNIIDHKIKNLLNISPDEAFNELNKLYDIEITRVYPVQETIELTKADKYKLVQLLKETGKDIEKNLDKLIVQEKKLKHKNLKSQLFDICIEQSIFIICKYAQYDLLKYMYNLNNIKMNVRHCITSFDKYTCLHFASYSDSITKHENRINIIKFLIDHNTPRYIKNVNGEYPHQSALYANYEQKYRDETTKLLVTYKRELLLKKTFFSEVNKEISLQIKNNLNTNKDQRINIISIINSWENNISITITIKPSETLLLIRELYMNLLKELFELNPIIDHNLSTVSSIQHIYKIQMLCDIAKKFNFDIITDTKKYIASLYKKYSNNKNTINNVRNMNNADNENNILILNSYDMSYYLIITIINKELKLNYNFNLIIDQYIKKYNNANKMFIINNYSIYDKQKRIYGIEAYNIYCTIITQSFSTICMHIGLSQKILEKKLSIITTKFSQKNIHLIESYMSTFYNTKFNINL